jgi:hypothetical protein
MIERATEVAFLDQSRERILGSMTLPSTLTQRNPFEQGKSACFRKLNRILQGKLTMFRDLLEQSKMLEKSLLRR